MPLREEVLQPNFPPGGALLAAAMQSPIASVVLIFELVAGTAKLALPLMFAVAGAVFVSSLMETRSIYSGRIHRFLRGQPKQG